MKQHNTYFRMIVTVSAVLAGLAACSVEDPRPQEEQGEMRRITLKATVEEPGTKVVIDDNNPGEVGAFHWSADDALAIYAVDGGVGAYYTTDNYGTHDADTENQFSVNLRGTRSGFAFYPASVVVSTAATAAVDPASPQINLPTSYLFADLLDGHYEPHASPMPMIAVNTEGQPLTFKHLGGMIRLELESSAQGPQTFYVAVGDIVDGEFRAFRINGVFDVVHPAATDIDNGNCYIQTSASDYKTGDDIWRYGSNYHTRLYNLYVINMEQGRTRTLNIPVPTGNYSTVVVRGIPSDETAVSMSGTYSLGPDGWNCQRRHARKLSVVIDPSDTEYYLDTPEAVELTYTGGSASLGEAFKSYKTIPGKEASGDTPATDPQSLPVPYHLEYSEDGGTTWSTTAPSWLGVTSPSSFAGSVAGEDLALTVEAQDNSGTDTHRDGLAERAPRGSDENPFDLSTVNVASGETVTRTTANCYVVSAPGFYKFPLVYGNALKDNLPNDAAFHRQQNTSTGATFPEYLVDHSGASITQPYIAQQPSVTGTLSARVIWTDAIGLVKNVGVSGSGQNAYLNFEVPADRICQGNALVAVFAGDVIVWSWHVWVTDEDLTVNKEVGSYRFSPVNLGWCEGRTEIYAERSCQVRAVQDAPGVADQNQLVKGPVTITQTEASIQSLGNTPYYQWGRKDPMQAANCIDGFKVYYSDYAAPDVVTGSVTVGASIQAPYSFYAGAPMGSWCSDGYVNLWNTLETTKSEVADELDDVTKTVYDPCPVGYEVGTLSSWYPLNGETTTTWVPASGTNPAGREYTVNGLFFPAVGARNGGNGSVDAHQVSYGDFWAAQHISSFGGHGAHLSDAGMISSHAQVANMNVGMSIRPIKQSFTVTGENLIQWDD